MRGAGLPNQSGTCTAAVKKKEGQTSMTFDGDEMSAVRQGVIREEISGEPEGADDRSLSTAHVLYRFLPLRIGVWTEYVR